MLFVARLCGLCVKRRKTCPSVSPLVFHHDLVAKHEDTRPRPVERALRRSALLLLRNSAVFRPGPWGGGQCATAPGRCPLRGEGLKASEGGRERTESRRHKFTRCAGSCPLSVLIQVVRQENLCLPRGERLDTVLVACVMPLALRDKCARAARWGQEDMFRDAPLSARAKLLAHAQMGKGGVRACACALSARVSEAEGV